MEGRASNPSYCLSTAFSDLVLAATSFHCQSFFILVRPDLQSRNHFYFRPFSPNICAFGVFFVQVTNLIMGVGHLPKMQDQGGVLIKRPITPCNHPPLSLFFVQKIWAIDFLIRGDYKISKILKGVWVLRASGESNLLRGSLWFLLIASAATLGVFRFGNNLTIYQ